MEIKIERTEVTRKTHDGRDWTDISEKFEIDGNVYSREGYLINGEVSDSISSHHFTSEKGDIQVRCGNCHKEKFTLSYGDYECIAKCVSCGMDARVYSG